MEFIQWDGKIESVKSFGINDPKVYDNCLYFASNGLMFKAYEGDYIIKTLKGYFLSFDKDSFESISERIK